MDKERAFEILEQARKQQSCDLADGLIDDLVRYWEAVEEAIGNVLGDDECVEALGVIAGDEQAMGDLMESHGGFFKALVRRGEESGRLQAKVERHPAEGTISADYPDIADFLVHGLYETFAVPDAFGTFEMIVFPDTCKVMIEHLNPGGDVSGYTLDNGKLLLVTREHGEVIDIRYAEGTTNNVLLIMRQDEEHPFAWASVESPDHEALRRMGALPQMP